MYFHYYGQLLHQQNMLQDYVRTGKLNELLNFAFLILHFVCPVKLCYWEVTLLLKIQIDVKADFYEFLVKLFVICCFLLLNIR